MSEEFFTKVAGVTRQNADGSLRQDIIEDLEEEWQAGEALKLTLRREPDNAYDRNAVAVLDAEGRQVGYLSRPVASSVAPRMDRGEAVAAELQAVTGGSLTHNYGVNIKIVVGAPPRRPTPPPAAKPAFEPTSHESGAPRAMSTDIFLAEARRAGLHQVALSIAYWVDDDGFVRKFDFVLMGPVEQDDDARPGVVTHVDHIPASTGDLAGQLARDDPGNLWFSDGYRIPANREYVATVRRAGRPIGQRVRSTERVAAFFDLLQRIDDAGLQPQIVGSGLKPILQWAEYTHRASQDPGFRKELEQALGETTRGVW